jgi:hypothetical protein
MQGKFSFYGKGTGNFLPTQHDVAAAMLEMPLKKSGEGRKRSGKI